MAELAENRGKIAIYLPQECKENFIMPLRNRVYGKKTFELELVENPSVEDIQMFHGAYYLTGVKVDEGEVRMYNIVSNTAQQQRIIRVLEQMVQIFEESDKKVIPMWLKEWGRVGVYQIEWKRGEYKFHYIPEVLRRTLERRFTY